MPEEYSRTIEVDVFEGTRCANQATKCQHPLWQHASMKPYECRQSGCQCEGFSL